MRDRLLEERHRVFAGVDPGARAEGLTDRARRVPAARGVQGLGAQRGRRGRSPHVAQELGRAGLIVQPAAAERAAASLAGERELPVSECTLVVAGCRTYVHPGEQHGGHGRDIRHDTLEAAFADDLLGRVELPAFEQNHREGSAAQHRVPVVAGGVDGRARVGLGVGEAAGAAAHARAVAAGRGERQRRSFATGLRDGLGEQRLGLAIYRRPATRRPGVRPARGGG